MKKGKLSQKAHLEAHNDEQPYPEGVPRRAVRSFENLVALANDAERLRDARKMVWRDRGEPAVELKTLEECLRHALRGALSKCGQLRRQ